MSRSYPGLISSRLKNTQDTTAAQTPTHTMKTPRSYIANRILPWWLIPKKCPSAYHICATQYMPAIAPTINICTFKPQMSCVKRGSFLVTFNYHFIFCCCMTYVHLPGSSNATVLALTLTPTLTFLWFWNLNTCILATTELNPDRQEEQILELQASGLTQTQLQLNANAAAGCVNRLVLTCYT